ncbi:PspC domain-containing protein [Arsenicicoccus dermatophilus]|uniref:ATP-binding protein n=1 Tax=Arsenicicoccus dermatophilus TaxID=1076331 RepID=UPI001F4CE933|nr:PspC domain-containing protein [Arsenicicoccus dermatophilus]
MPPSYEQATPPAAASPQLLRPVDDGWVAGVCAGLGEHLGVRAVLVRVGMVLLTVGGMGLGILVYLAVWALTPQRLGPAEGRRAAPTVTGGRAAAPRRPRLPRSGLLHDEAVLTLLLGLVLVVGGGAVLLHQGGVDLRLGVTAPLALVAGGAIVVWTQLDRSERERFLQQSSGESRAGLARVLTGVLMTTAGVVVLAARAQGIGGLGDAALSAAAVLVGLVVILAPWGMRLWQRLRAEQAAAVRATERADIAAHLHDSVLQTLALIQRQAEDPVAVQRLARAQERELRSWLYGGGDAAPTTLAAAARGVVHDVEDRHGVPVDLVVTGDVDLDDDVAALVRALGEALTNAARHGVPPVSAYVEAGPLGVEAFVRDHGDGFDPDEVPEDRLGVRRSIVGRMQRHGGSARIRRREPGTEVELVLPPYAERLHVPADPAHPPEDR